MHKTLDMKKTIFLLLATICFFAKLQAQNVQLFDPVSNRTFSAEKYTDIRGVPFLFDKWIKANVYNDKGVYEGLEIKYDLFENKLYFNKNDESYELQDNVLNFVLFPKPGDASTAMYYRKGFKGSGLNESQFVQVLVDGKLQLIKSDVKSLTEMSEINAGMVKTFATTTRYYMISKTGTQIVRLNKSEILPFLQDKDAQIQSYITEKGLNLKKDADLITLVKYYNSL
jgi:hypothetical protein